MGIWKLSESKHKDNMDIEPNPLTPNPTPLNPFNTTERFLNNWLLWSVQDYDSG